jgi:hypothetical protein
VKGAFRPSTDRSLEVTGQFYFLKERSTIMRVNETLIARVFSCQQYSKVLLVENEFAALNFP